MTVCVPLAIRHETPETIERFMQQIINASSNVENGVNVLIWANAKYNENENSIDVKQQSEALYEELRQKLLDLENKPESANITISTALEVVPSSEFSMSQIRNNYMEAITGRLIDGEIDETHPIVWLDADTTRIRPNTLSAIQRHIKKTPTSSIIRTLIILLNGWKESDLISGILTANYYSSTRWLSVSISELQWRKAYVFSTNATQMNLV
jgi:hypothetical protein